MCYSLKYNSTLCPLTDCKSLCRQQEYCCLIVGFNCDAEHQHKADFQYVSSPTTTFFTRESCECTGGERVTSHPIINALEYFLRLCSDVYSNCF